MSDVMLINPSSKDFLTNAGDRMPLGLLYIAGYLENQGHNVRVRDLDHVSLSSLEEEVQKSPPDILGVSVLTSVLYPQAIKIASLFPNIHKVAGGYHATAMPETLTPYYETVVVGEGEKALHEIAVSGIKGVVLGQKTPVEEITHPARHLLNKEDYIMLQQGEPTATLMSSRGCPNACVFCGNMNRQMRYFSDDFVIEELKQLKEMGYQDFYFLDDAFSINKKRTLGLLEKIADLDINFRATMRARSVDDDIAYALANAGCEIASLGIESGSDKCLKAVGKNMTTEDNVKALMKLTENGILTKGFFIFGLPEETIYDAQCTLNFSQSLKKMGVLHYADFYICTPFPGTELWNNPDKYGFTIHDRDYTKYLEIGKGPARAYHDNGHLSRVQIETIRNEAERRWKS